MLLEIYLCYFHFQIGGRILDYYFAQTSYIIQIHLLFFLFHFLESEPN